MNVHDDMVRYTLTMHKSLVSGNVASLLTFSYTKKVVINEDRCLDRYINTFLCCCVLLCILYAFRGRFIRRQAMRRPGRLIYRSSLAGGWAMLMDW